MNHETYEQDRAEAKRIVKIQNNKQEVMNEIIDLVASVSNIPSERAALRNVVSKTLDEINLLKKTQDVKIIKKILQEFMDNNKIKLDSDEGLIDALVNLMANIIVAKVKDLNR